MSFNRLKETLKPCSSSSSDSQPPPPSQNPNYSRKPPKSSLFQQLKRLDSEFPSSDRTTSYIPTKPALPVVADKKRAEEEDDEDEGGGGGGSRVSGFGGFVGESVSAPAAFSLGPNGPFEPLVLSSPGEVSVVQEPLRPPFVIQTFKI